MRAGIIVKVTRSDRHRLEAIVSDRSASQKHVWRANIILATADGCGTAEIMRRSASPSQWFGSGRPGSWRRHRRADTRQDAQAQQTTTADLHRAESGRPGARAAAGSNNPLDRSDAGESRRGEPAFGATEQVPAGKVIRSRPGGSVNRPTSSSRRSLASTTSKVDPGRDYIDTR